MKRSKNPTWTIGDGSFRARALNVLVSRQANRTSTSPAGSTVQTNDRWIISFDHDDGCGEEINSNISLSHISTSDGNLVTINAITNDQGRWKTASEFEGVNIDQPINPRGSSQVKSFPLLSIVQGIYAQARLLSGWGHLPGSPLDHMAEEGAMMFTHFDNVKLPLFKPEVLCFADVNQTFSDYMANDYSGLGMRMNAGNPPSLDYPSGALLIRYEAMVEGALPEGVTANEFVSQLVRAGLSLGPMDYVEDFGGPDARVRGTTSLLAKAVELDRIDLIEALMLAGADPLQELNRQVATITHVSSPLLNAALSDKFSAVVTIMNHISSDDAEHFRESFNERKAFMSREVADVVYAHQARNCVRELLKLKSPSPG